MAVAAMQLLETRAPIALMVSSPASVKSGAETNPVVSK